MSYQSLTNKNEYQKHSIGEDVEDQNSAVYGIGKVNQNKLQEIFVFNKPMTIIFILAMLLLSLFFAAASKAFSKIELMSEPSPLDPATIPNEFIFKHWEPSNIVGKVQSYQLASFHEQRQEYYSTNVHVAQSISASVGAKFESLSAELKYMASLDKYYSSYSSRIYTSMLEYGVSMDADYGQNDFGFMQDRVRVQFEDQVVDIVLSENLMHRDQFSSSTFLSNIRKYFNFDRSVLVDLLMTYDESLTADDIAKADSCIRPVVVPGKYSRLVEFLTYYKEVKSATEQYKDHQYSVTAMYDNGYDKFEGCSFKCLASPKDATWIPVYGGWNAQIRHHLYSTDPATGSLMCYVAQSAGGDANLKPIYISFDSKYQDHLYGLTQFYNAAGILGYAYDCSYN